MRAILGASGRSLTSMPKFESVRFVDEAQPCPKGRQGQLMLDRDS